MIKTIIFDFGDVFVNLDKAATRREMENLNVSEFPEIILEKNLEYEKGLISSDEFIGFYREEFPHLESEQVVDSWNAILIDFPEYRFQFIKKLAEEKDFQLILLSNTNEIHIDWIKKNVLFFKEFKDCFDAFYLSHEINFRKPNANIYEFVLETHELLPEECLFIDDTTANTEAASDLGLHTWNIEPTREDVIDLFTAKKELF